ncbi:hypothetical protein FFIC_283400 [Fructobacillus ficulneus]|uniref:Uncharacterized protein n=1 Tax=Fructobacillus ficulneus TaxID=157463 RepID=A0A0K8MIN9_9LACO|nr:hypothetical protein FFIC_283400 [Fructobacillus ficulneus]
MGQSNSDRIVLFDSVMENAYQYSFLEYMGTHLSSFMYYNIYRQDLSMSSRLLLSMSKVAENLGDSCWTSGANPANSWLYVRFLSDFGC